MFIFEKTFYFNNKNEFEAILSIFSFINYFDYNL